MRFPDSFRPVDKADAESMDVRLSFLKKPKTRGMAVITGMDVNFLRV